MITMRRLRFFAATPTRGTSIEERLGANPAGRTIVSSFAFRWGITVQSKLANCSTKLAKGRCRAEQWRCGYEDHRDEEKCFANKIAARLVFKILAANISKRWCLDFGASAPTLLKCHWLIIAVSQRKAPAVTSCYRDRLHWSFLSYLPVVIAMFVPTAEAMSQGSLHQWLTFHLRIAAAALLIRLWDCVVPTSGRFPPHCLQRQPQQSLRAHAIFPVH